MMATTRKNTFDSRPLLATRNDQRQRIANGDTGIVVTTDAGLIFERDTVITGQLVEIKGAPEAATA